MFFTKIYGLNLVVFIDLTVHFDLSGDSAFTQSGVSIVDDPLRLRSNSPKKCKL